MKAEKYRIVEWNSVSPREHTTSMIKAWQPLNEFCYFVPQARSHRVSFPRGLGLGRVRNGVLSAMTDRARPLDQSEGMARQSIELLRIALASGGLQCIDSSAAKLFRVLWFLGTIKVGHCR
jgi:hypothetical protein